MINVTDGTSFLMLATEAMLVAVIGLKMFGIETTFRQYLVLSILEAGMYSYIESFQLPFGIFILFQVVVFSLVIYLVQMRVPFKIILTAVLLGVNVLIYVKAALALVLIISLGASLTDGLSDYNIKVILFLLTSAALLFKIGWLSRINVWLRTYYQTITSGSPTDRVALINKPLPFLGIYLTQNLLIFGFIYTRFTESYSLNQTLFQWSYIPLIAILALLQVLIIPVARITMKLVQQETELRTRVESLNYVQDLIHTIRAQRHDFNHHLQTVYGLLEVEAFEEAREYIGGSFGEIAATAELMKTDNLGITALLYMKRKIADSRRIRFQVNILTSLQEMVMELRDLTIILGNLIDNAFEAVQDHPTANREVELTISQGLSDYIFQVRNYGVLLESRQSDSIFTAGFSTKGTGRGMGLYSVSEMVKKYNGKVEATCDSGYTLFTVTLSYELLGGM